MHERLEPTLPGFYSDPSICRAGQDFYLTTSSFEYFPGCPLFHSRDLKTWRQIGHVLDRPELLPLDGAWISGGIYAPTIRHQQGRFYLITTNTSAPGRGPGGQNFIVHSDNPAGDWAGPLWIEGMWGIDPDLFWDEDGTCYAQWSQREQGCHVDMIRIAQAAIDPLRGKLLEPPRTLWTGSGGLGVEGPHLYRIPAGYLLSCAEGGTEYGHMQTLARSAKATGPFEPCPRNPVLTHRSLASAVHAVGHADLVEGPDGTWFGVCHGIRPQGYHPFHVCGRETFAFSVSWDDDGWPVLGEHGRLPERTITGTVSTNFSDEFTRATPPFDWNYLRNPIPENYRRTSGQLTIHGSRDRISENGRPSWIGVRQRSHTCRCETRLSIGFQGDGEAGLSVFQNLRHHACIGLRQLHGRVEGFTRIRLGDLVVEDAFDPDTDVEGLGLVAEPLHYHLEIVGSETQRRVKTIAARLLSTELGGLFTGVYFALYAEGEACLNTRQFTVYPGSG